MVTSVLKVGDKLDIKVQQKGDTPGQTVVRTLKSVIYDLGKNGELEIAMPTDGGKMVLLTLGVRYECIFYSKKSMYGCYVVVKRRYKDDGLFMVTVEPVTELKKVQRRAYFRFACDMDLKFLPVTPEERKMLTAEEMLWHHKEMFPEEAFRIGTALDLSGGGVRIVTKEQMQEGEYILIDLPLFNDVISKHVWVLGKMVRVGLVPDRHNLYELRVEFVITDDTVREGIIKYIFEEDRKKRKKLQGLTE